MSNMSISNALSRSEIINDIKILLSGLELIENVATMHCTKISSNIQCIRCKTKCHVLCCKKSSNQCSKCHKMMCFKFESSTIHEFSNVLGILSISGCQVVDINIVESDFLVDCLNCSKQIAVHDLHYGQKYTTCCISCNKKILFRVGGVRIISSKTVCNSGKNPSLHKEKKSKNPVLIKEGEPLPDFGICKHYKKSYRWLRFPCCGKIFACDICHSEQEKDHEMKFASRMICGFCAKEQPYSKDKPCIVCSSSMTKITGSHWDGGKGCRDKTQLSRSDKQKYSGVSKTVSRKAQDKICKKIN